MSGQSFPIVDAIVGATLEVAALHLILDGEGARPDARSSVLSSVGLMCTMKHRAGDYLR